MKYLNLTAPLLAIVLLNGCLEVEDNNSDISALLEQDSGDVNIKGVIVNALDSAPVENALITVKVGTTEVLSNVEVTSGNFELSGLPEYSDIDIIISSPDNSFLSRTFFSQTYNGSTSGITDLGSFAVSESIDVEISVIDNATNDAFPSLEFIGYSYSGSSSSAYEYQHVSTFDADTGIYTITLPKFINTTIRANVDFDKDGTADYIPEVGNFLSSDDLYISSANTKEFTTIYINEVEDADASELEVRFSVIDESAQPISGAIFYVDDNKLDSSFDEENNQYVISAPFEGSIDIQIPAFTSNDINYQSTAVRISENDDGTLYIRNYDNYNGSCCLTIPNADVIDFVISPEVITESDTPVQLVFASQEVTSADNSFSAFYSQGIEVNEENVTLNQRYGFTVLKGNDNDDDLILPGTTLITGNISIPVTSKLTLNNTRLTITPDISLLSGEYYEYEVGTITNKANQETSDIYADRLSFETEFDANTIFDPADITVDNENYTTNGVAITSTNTAGEPASPYDYNGSVYIYLPNSINTLQNLTIKQISYIRDGVSNIDTRTSAIVVDGQVQVSAVGVVRLAQNENYSQDNLSRTVIVSSAQQETQKAYRTYASGYLSDNTNSNENSVSFTYAYETKDGEVFTGNITLPVQ